MTIATAASKVTAQGNGATTAFSYGFLIPSASNVAVIYTDANGNATVLNSNQYTISGIGNASGGLVTYPLSGSPIATGTSLTIQRLLPYQQSTSLVNQGGYFPDVVELALDNLEMQIQQLVEQLSRTIVGAVSDGVNLTLTLPAAAFRASQLLGFDAAGNVQVYTPNTSVVSASTITYGAESIATSLQSKLARVVTSVANLRLVSKATYTQALVTGYSVGGDGGGGVYYYDSSDTTTADNGGSVIVAADGGRWKLATTVSMSVKQFGANSGGVSDTTAAFNLAKNSGATRITVPAGNYLITAPFTLNVAGQEWILDKGATLLRNTGGSGSVVSIQASSVKWNGGAINGNSGTISAGSGIDITGVGSTSCTIENCSISNCYVYGIYCEGPGATIRGNTVTATNSIGIFVTMAAGAVSDQNAPKVLDNEVDQRSLATSVNTSGIFVKGNNTGPVNWLNPKVSRNRVYLVGSPTGGAQPVAIEFTYCLRGSMTDNYAEGGYIGLSQGNCNDVAVSGNEIYGPTQIGIEIAQNTAGCTASANTIDGLSKTTFGFQVSSGGTPSNRNIVTGNTVRRVLGTTGVCINLTGSGANAVTSNNLFPAGAQAGIYAAASSNCTFANNVIEGNGTATYGIQIDTPIGETVTGNTVHNCVTGITLTCSTATTLDFNVVSNNALQGNTNTITTNLVGGAVWGNSNQWIANVGYQRNGYSANVLDVKNDVIECWGGASPAGTVVAGLGSICHNFAGGAGTSQYVKESGAGAATGWVGK